METNADTEIVMDFTLRVIIDLVSGPDDAPEYRCSIYDEDGSLLSDGWGDTPNSSRVQAMAR